MIDEIKILIDNYCKWLHDKTVLRQIDDWVEITTPYVDRHNDYLQIYAKRHDGGYLLTDDGYILQDLFASGCKLDSPRRQVLLRMALNGYGVKLEGDRLEILASKNNFSYKKHNLVQAMMSINDLFYLAAPMISSVFLEDVAAWLNLHEIRYTPQIKFTGKTGYDHLFDFVIPRSKAQPERILKAINHPNRDSAQSFVFSWLDTRETRKEVGFLDSKAYAILNDSDHHEIPTAVFDALKNYEIDAILWSRREDVVSKLAA